MNNEFFVSMVDRDTLEAFLGEERVNKLSDKEMQEIADDLNGRLVEAGYWEQELREARDESVILEGD